MPRTATVAARPPRPCCAGRGCGGDARTGMTRIAKVRAEAALPGQWLIHPQLVAGPREGHVHPAQPLRATSTHFGLLPVTSSHFRSLPATSGYFRSVPDALGLRISVSRRGRAFDVAVRFGVRPPCHCRPVGLAGRAARTARTARPGGHSGMARPGHSPGTAPGQPRRGHGEHLQRSDAVAASGTARRA